MLSEAQPVSFVATSKPDEALAFYRDKLGFVLERETEIALEFRMGPAKLRVQRTAAFEPLPVTVAGWQVADVRKEIADLKTRGVEVCHFSYVDQDADGIWWTPRGNGVAWFKDPDGNLLSIVQFTHEVL